MDDLCHISSLFALSLSEHLAAGRVIPKITSKSITPINKQISTNKQLAVIGDKLKVKVLEIKTSEQKVRVGLKQTQKDPFDYFKDKKINDTITVKIISSDNKGLVVQPEGCEMSILIKKSQIAVNASDARPSRFVGGERIDSAIAELNFEKRKVSLSIKLLEEIQKKEALDKYGAEGSGKNLPFSTLSDKLKKKDKEKK